VLVKRAVVYLQNNYAQPLSLLKIAHEIGVNKTTLQKNFHQELGISPWEYLKRFRIKEAKRLLETTNLSITEVAAAIGFDNLPYFSRMFRTHTGQSPKEYRNSAV
jgi:transcriptional regulator GlxA family with amidase domain